MEKIFYRSQINILLQRLQESRARIQVLFGPRQVGKTTLARQITQRLDWPTHMATADAVGTAVGSWISLQWQQARLLTNQGQRPAILILDEVQKIQQWSEFVKKYWDEDSNQNLPLHVIILGSSPLLMQRGLTESLAGRFEQIPVTHWSYLEMKEAFGYSLDEYIYFGGYPGAHDLIDDPPRWSQFILDSLVETTLSRDIFLMTRIDKPALFRQLFELGCLASGQILSFQKILGQLQDAGNSTTLAGYLQLLTGARLLGGIQKFSKSTTRTKASSPKFQVYNNALLSAWEGKSLAQRQAEPEKWGRLVESAVGAYLINLTDTHHFKLSYWNIGEAEVDFIVQKDKRVLAIEVKSGRRQGKISAMDKFLNQFPGAVPIQVGTGGIALEEFFSMPFENLLAL